MRLKPAELANRIRGQVELARVHDPVMLQGLRRLAEALRDIYLARPVPYNRPAFDAESFMTQCGF